MEISPEQLQQPLAPDEWMSLIVQLNDDPRGLQFNVATGLLTAVASAPTHISPSRWIPLVLGEQGREERDDSVVKLVLRMFSTIYLALERGRAMAPKPDQHESLKQFCTGYLMGVDLDEIWRKDDVAMEPLAPISLLSGEQQLDEDDDEHAEQDWMQAAREGVAPAVLEAFNRLAHYRNERSAPPEKTSYQRDQPKVGRNDPCTCGSGKKYKKCCGR